MDDILSTLNSPKFQQDNPSLQLDNQTKRAIYLVAGILNQIVPKPPTPTSTDPTLQPQKINTT